jgi:hypothetical protein
MQVVQASTPYYRIAQIQIAATVLQKLDEDNKFLRKIAFCDQATVPFSGKVNKQNVHMWGTEHPHATVEHIRDSHEVNV